MKHILGWVLCSAVAALSLIFASATRAAPGAIRVGDLAQFTWRTPLVNGMGATAIEDLRGKPVLFDFWGVR
jgi:hypothetical protein